MWAFAPLENVGLLTKESIPEGFRCLDSPGLPSTGSSGGTKTFCLDIVRKTRGEELHEPVQHSGMWYRSRGHPEVRAERSTQAAGSL